MDQKTSIEKLCQAKSDIEVFSILLEELGSEHTLLLFNALAAIERILEEKRKTLQRRDNIFR